MYERYRGRSLEEEFEREGISAEEASALFDEVDEKFGANILSSDVEIRNAALNGSALLIASFVANRKLDRDNWYAGPARRIAANIAKLPRLCCDDSLERGFPA